MENIDRVLQKFINSSDGEFIVTDTLWKILFKSGVIDIDTEKWERWVRLYKDDPTDGLDMDWEILLQSLYQGSICRGQPLSRASCDRCK